jgi:colanic acid/amylovoran biosynthesis glycosyltransferase
MIPESDSDNRVYNDMKVCFATYDSSHIGGATIFLERLLPLLQTAGIEPEVHAMGRGGKPGLHCTFFKEQGITVRWTPLLMHVPYAVRSFLRLLEEGQPDIYVPFFVLPAYYAAGYARRAGIPTVGFLCADELYFSGIVDEFINGDPDFRLSAVVPVSGFLESQASAGAAARGVIVRRIANGIPIPARTAEPAGPVFRLVYTGRLVEEAKRISEVTKALCAAAQNIPNLEAWMTGEGDAPAVEAIIRERGMGSRVRLLGRVDDVYDVLAQCHGLVLLSDYEGLPVSVLEAMATGVVPICLDTRSGVGEAIEHGVNGLIVKDRGADFLAAVRGLQRDPAKWQQLSLAARDTAQRRYSIEESARQWVDLLEDLFARKPARSGFPAFGALRLPPANPKFGIYGASLPWPKRTEDYIKTVPPLYRMARAAIAVRRTVKSQAGRLF